MIKRKLTQAAMDASRANAKKSTGPRTAAGRRVSSRNAITHGFFCRELVLKGEDRQQLDAICTRLRSELTPETALQEIGFEEIAANIGRCKSALRPEMLQVARAFARDDQQPQSGESDRPSAKVDWYLSGKQGLREGLRLLDELKQEFEQLGRIDEKWNEVLDSAFGPRFRQMLTRWDPRDMEAALFAQQLTSHAKTYNMPLPPWIPASPRFALIPFRVNRWLRT